jgi:peptide deformylase
MRVIPHNRNNVLHEPCKVVDNAENRLICHLKRLMITTHKTALGIASNQIGIPKQIFIARLSSGLKIFYNPIITGVSDDQFRHEERCLSFPNKKVAKILRYSWVELTHGIEGEFKDRFAGLESCIIQHECDHLNGVTIFD